MNFEFQPTLTGERVLLRPLKALDFEDLYSVAKDPLIWELHPERDRYKEEVFRNFFQGAVESRGAFVVIDRASGKIIGSSRYHPYIQEDGTVADDTIEIGWTFLARDYWGGSYNREMKHLMMRHAFQFVHRALFVIGKHNYRSQRATEKLGGKRIGERLDDAGKMSYVYEITRSAIDIPDPPAR
jgi:N-acetyltransferase